MTACDPKPPLTVVGFKEVKHDVNVLNASSPTQSPRLSALFAVLSNIALFALMAAKHSGFNERLDAFVGDQIASPSGSGQPLNFPEFSGLAGDGLSITLALVGSLFAIAAIYFGGRSWKVSGQSKLLLFLSRCGVAWGALSLFWIGVVSF
ncbi:MAG: hypothetical protein MUO51_09435 [Woeseiaceae bacterium]|nr:hypothetical protein [Woeseiaceae bacterium]